MDPSQPQAGGSNPTNGQPSPNREPSETWLTVAEAALQPATEGVWGSRWNPHSLDHPESYIRSPMPDTLHSHPSAHAAESSSHARASGLDEGRNPASQQLPSDDHSAPLGLPHHPWSTVQSSTPNQGMRPSLFPPPSSHPPLPPPPPPQRALYVPSAPNHQSLPPLRALIVPPAPTSTSTSQELASGRLSLEGLRHESNYTVPQPPPQPVTYNTLLGVPPPPPLHLRRPWEDGHHAIGTATSPHPSSPTSLHSGQPPHSGVQASHQVSPPSGQPSHSNGRPPSPSVLVPPPPHTSVQEMHQSSQSSAQALHLLQPTQISGGLQHSSGQLPPSSVQVPHPNGQLSHFNGQLHPSVQAALPSHPSVEETRQFSHSGAASHLLQPPHHAIQVSHLISQPPHPIGDPAHLQLPHPSGRLPHHGGRSSHFGVQPFRPPHLGFQSSDPSHPDAQASQSSGRSSHPSAQPLHSSVQSSHGGGQRLHSHQWPHPSGDPPPPSGHPPPPPPNGHPPPPSGHPPPPNGPPPPPPPNGHSPSGQPSHTGGRASQPSFQAPPHHLQSDAPPLPGWVQYIGREIRLNLDDALKAYQNTIQHSIDASVAGMEGRLLDRLAGPVTMETDGEEDAPLKKASHRKTRRKRTEDENNYHSVMRGWLAEKSLQRTGALPPLPPKLQEVRAFFDYCQGPGPSAASPRFDWHSQFSSEWNNTLLLLLAEEWLRYISTVGDFDRESLDKSFFDLAGVKKLLTTKLREVRKIFFEHYDPQTEMLDSLEQGRLAFESRKREGMEKSRHNSRLHGTFTRRQKIIEHHQLAGHHPLFWAAAGEMLDTLGEQGMSSDESEAEQPHAVPYGRKRKTVRRIPRRWLAPDIALVWRLFEGREQPDSFVDPTSVVQDLPINWYNQLWWKQLLPVRRAVISSTPVKPFPDVPMQVSM